jgi:hypothetical protein
MSISKKRIRRSFNTVWAICTAPTLDQYVVGRTNNVKQREASYRGQGYEHLVVLADQLTDKDAKTLEARLQGRIGVGKHRPSAAIRREVTYKKYHKNKVNDIHHPSTGSGKHSIYMTWWEN